MKKIFLFLLPALMLFAAGCKDKNQPENLPQTLSVNPELITCPDAGGDYTIEVNSPNGAWSATSNESWIRVTPTAGKAGASEVRIKISPNKESAETKGIITFTSGEETVSFPVTRAAKAAPYLRIVSDIELNTPKEGGTYTVQIESNIKWSASSNAGWAKVNKGVSVNNDRFTVTVSPATTPEETTARIIVSPYGEGYDAGSDTVIITRGSTEATSLSVDPTEITAPENGGSFTVNVSSNAKWRVWKTWDMDWLTLSGSQDGDGNGSFSFSIEEATSMDAVSGILTIEEDRSDNYKPVVTQVAVSRKGKAAADLTVAPIAINASAEGGNYPVAVKSNYPWTATTSGNFFSLSSTSGDGYSTIVVSVNPATDERENTGYIIIRTSFGNEQARINIKRAGKEPEPESMYVMRPFSVSETKQVYFSPGNLQYRASTGTWRFAERQWDFVGLEKCGTVFENGTKCNNNYISDTYDGWIDLFGWGTGNAPTKVSTDFKDYYFADWGANSIYYGNTLYNTYTWRTLTKDEWWHLFFERTNAAELFGMSRVNEVVGLVLLPDNWTLPAGVSFMSGREQSYRVDSSYYKYPSKGYTARKSSIEYNEYTIEQWAVMEAAGAVFLPAADIRTTAVFLDRSGIYRGYYWSANQKFMNAAGIVFFSNAYIIPVDRHSFTDGLSVRLVKDAN